MTNDIIQKATFTKTKMVTHGNVTIEKNCCMMFEDKKFCSGGAFISEKYITAYLSSDGTKITNWQGNETLTNDIIKLSKFFNPFDVYGQNRDAFYLRFKYKNRIYSGLCLGNGCSLKARLTKRKTLS